MIAIDNLIDHLKSSKPYDRNGALKLYEALKAIHNELIRLNSIKSILEVPAGAINGSNKEFLLTEIPEPGESITIYKNGVPLTEAEFEIVDNKLLRLKVAPAGGASLQVSYFEKGEYGL